MAHLDFANRLAIYGYTKEVEDFDNEIIKLWKKSYGEEFVTVEYLLCTPEISLTFCEEIRDKTGVITICNQEILLRLLNLRKRGLLK